MSLEQPQSRRAARDVARDHALNSVRGRLVDVLFVLAMLAVAAIPLWPIYQHSMILTLVGVGLGAATLVALIGAAATWPWYAMASVTALTYVLIGVPLAVPAEARWGVLPTLDGLNRLFVGTTGAWKEALTAQVPFGTYQALGVPALVMVLGCGVASLSLALRLRRPAWALLGPLVLLAFGIAFGSAHTQWPIGAGLGVFTLAVSWAAVRFGRGRPGISGRRRAWVVLRHYAAAVAILATCAAGATAIVGFAPPGTDRHVLRDAVTPPFEPRELVSPLVGFRNSVLPPGADTTLFHVTGLPDDARIRLATLDTYNGVVFSVGSGTGSSGSFERVPYRLDPRPGRRVEVTVQVAEYDDVWVPTVGDLVSIRFGSGSTAADSFVYNRATGAAAIRSGLGAGTRYTLDAVVAPSPDEQTLAKLRPSPIGQPPAGEIPRELIDAAKEHAGKSTAPGARLVSLARWLRAGYVSHGGEDEPSSRPGHSADRLTELVTTSPMLGDAEQYAPTLALLAREIGFPSRVVLGFAPAPDRTEITGADLTAWVEVRIADGEWVAVDPNPEPRKVPGNRETTPQEIHRPQTVLPPPPPQENETATSRNDETDGPREDPSGPGWTARLVAVLRLVGVGLGTIALLTFPLWMIALAAAGRRFRRRRADRRDVVLTGGWNEVRDAMIDRGFGVHPAATRAEIASLTTSRTVADLAERADVAAFGGKPPSPADVAAYWADTKQARRSLDAGVRRRDRLRTALSLQSLRRSSRAALAARDRRRAAERAVRAEHAERAGAESREREPATPR